MALTISNIQFDPVNGIWTCAGSNDGSSAAASIYPGFKPRTCKVVNLTDVTIHEADLNTGAGKAIKTVTAGTTTLQATNAVTFLDSSVTSGATTVATGSSSNTTAGGVTLGTDILLASKSFTIKLER